MGEHTGALVRSGASVTCLDIAPAALKTLTRRFANGVNPPKTVVGDIESLPLLSASMDVITGAGVLSYGDPNCVNREIFRVLKPGGSLVCVDSLNHNWVYRLNRWRRFRRGERSRSTLLRMPTLSRLHSLSEPFASADVRFFGAMTWAVAALVPLVGQRAAAALSDRIDSAVGVRRSAFKFVLLARAFQKVLGVDDKEVVHRG
jgi:ubiquinone/menaquinone biosynthesis C-methylase UbiE